MGGAGIQRPVRNTLFVNDRQGVDVGSEGDCRRIVAAAADVAQQSGAFGQDSGTESSRLKPTRDPAGCAVLGVTDLRMGMQVPAELDQLGLVAIKKRF
jgi:hypothetical protein